MKEVFEITCDCGLKFSSEKYYNEHLNDVKEAKRLLRSTHKKKKVIYNERGDL